jgi:hypothetical protein
MKNCRRQLEVVIENLLPGIKNKKVHEIKEILEVKNLKAEIRTSVKNKLLSEMGLDNLNGNMEASTLIILSILYDKHKWNKNNSQGKENKMDLEEINNDEELDIFTIIRSKHIEEIINEISRKMT